MNQLLAIVALWAVCHVIAWAQTPAPPDTAKAAPATKLEAFSARSGVVVVKAFTPLGAVPARGASLEIDAREFRDASNPKVREHGVVVELTEQDRLARTVRAYVDYDEIDSLLKGIEYISKVDAGITPLKEFEVEYRTRGGLEVVAFSLKGKISYSVSARFPRLNAFIDAPGLEAFRKKIVEAKALLETVRK